MLLEQMLRFCFLGPAPLATGSQGQRHILCALTNSGLAIYVVQLLLKCGAYSDITLHNLKHVPDSSSYFSVFA